MADDKTTIGTAVLEITTDNSKFTKGIAETQQGFTKISSNLKVLSVDLSAVNKIASGFLGREPIQNAENYAAAIQKVGGVTKLTADEQRRANDAISAGIEKYRALGAEAPAHLIALQDATTKAAKATTDSAGPVGLLSDRWKSFATGFVSGQMFLTGAEKAIEFGKSILDNAHEIELLSQKTGVSTDAIQRYQYVAKLSGSTVEDFTAALFKMEAQLGSKSTKAQDAADDLGIPWKELKALAPEQQLDLIIHKLAGLDDADRRAADEIGLFGKSAGDSIGRIIEDYDRLKNGAIIASKESIKALADIRNKTNEIEARTTSFVTAELGSRAIVLDFMAQHPVDFTKLVIMNPGLTDTATTGSLQPLAAAIADLQSKTKALGDEQKKTVPPSQDFVAALLAAHSAVAALSPATLAQIDAAIQMGKSTEDLTDTFGLNVAEIEILKKQLQDHEVAQRKAAEAAQKLADVNATIAAMQRPMTTETLHQIDALLALGLTTEQVTCVFRSIVNTRSDST